MQNSKISSCSLIPTILERSAINLWLRVTRWQTLPPSNATVAAKIMLFYSLSSFFSSAHTSRLVWDFSCVPVPWRFLSPAYGWDSDQPASFFFCYWILAVSEQFCNLAGASNLAFLFIVCGIWRRTCGSITQAWLWPTGMSVVLVHKH